VPDARWLQFGCTGALFEAIKTAVAATKALIEKRLSCEVGILSQA
jgi:hypothetical protein